MKKIVLLIVSLGFVAVAQGCVQTVSPATGSCPPTTGGTLQDLSANCYGATITAGSDFGIHLDSVRVFSGQTLEIIVKASTVAETSGWKISFSGGTAGTVRVSKLGTGQAMDSGTFDMTDGKTWCIDFHGGEDPDHIVFWKNNCTKTFANGEWGNAQFNSQREAASVVAGQHEARSGSNYGTGMTGCPGGSGTCFDGTDPAGTKVLYKADAGTTTSITVKTSITSGI